MIYGLNDRPQFCKFVFVVEMILKPFLFKLLQLKENVDDISILLFGFKHRFHLTLKDLSTKHTSPYLY